MFSRSFRAKSGLLLAQALLCSSLAQAGEDPCGSMTPRQCLSSMASQIASLTAQIAAMEAKVNEAKLKADQAQSFANAAGMQAQAAKTDALAARGRSDEALTKATESATKANEAASVANAAKTQTDANTTELNGKIPCGRAVHLTAASSVRFAAPKPWGAMALTNGYLKTSGTPEAPVTTGAQTLIIDCTSFRPIIIDPPVIGPIRPF